MSINPLAASGPAAVVRATPRRCAAYSPDQAVLSEAAATDQKREYIMLSRKRYKGVWKFSDSSQATLGGPRLTELVHRALRVAVSWNACGVNNLLFEIATTAGVALLACGYHICSAY